ncbi:MAG: thiamine phosphate synthase [Betaproteobacteria bacterium]|nr:thiamine phosphate synthase [Betaproteobacteria bacterium]
MSTERCAIRGLYAITPDIADTHRLQSLVQLAIDGGLTLLQYRAKTLPLPLRQAQAQALTAQCASQNVTFIVNDDAALAQACGAAGVHLGRDDDPLESLEPVGGKRSLLVGVSCYDSLPRAERAEASGADYVAFGSMFPSSTKPDAVQPPLSLLGEAKRRLRVPVVAIGGITLSRMDQLRNAGVDAVAVITALFDAPDIKKAAQQFNAYFEETP